MELSRQGAFAALLAMMLVAPISAHAQDGSAPKPGFFRQLGKGLADTGKQMVGIKTNTASKAGGQGTGSIYTPVSGAGKLPNLFKGDNHQAAQAGRLDWPRVALTFTEWGHLSPAGPRKPASGPARPPQASRPSAPASMLP